MVFDNLLWCMPFCFIILSMSLVPLLFPKFWHKYASYVPFSFSFIYFVFVYFVFGINKAAYAIYEPIFYHYIPFITLIFALYVTSGGVFIEFQKAAKGPIFNTAFLFFGSLLAGFIGTTGAAILLIRPFLRCNRDRIYKTHLVIFFIFLIANIGGVASPLGDPPLFIGFLEGIDFFWFIKNLYKHWVLTISFLSLAFFFLDYYLYRKENPKFDNIKSIESESAIVIHGFRNIFLIFVVLVAVIECNFDKTILIFGEKINLSSVIRNMIFILISVVSMKWTPHFIREKNNFSFEPIKEVAELFVGIFITVTPLISILHKGSSGELGMIFDWLAPCGEFIADRCFWISGMLSSVLDNAPTFLIFFHLTSGNAQILMTEKANILTALSLATVFMGALTYIGNAPNLMVKSIAQDFHVQMPSFLGYLRWSIAILIPLFILISLFL